MPTIKAQAVMANSIAVKTYVSQPATQRSSHEHPSLFTTTTDDVSHTPSLCRRPTATTCRLRPTTDDQRPTTFPHCTFCNLLISFCARFSSDSDHSSRVSAPTLFSTRVM